MSEPAATGSRSDASVDRDAIARLLRARHPDRPQDRVDQAVDEAIERLAGARVSRYLPILVERLAAEELRTTPH